MAQTQPLKFKVTFTSDVGYGDNIQIGYLEKPIKCHWCSKKTNIVSTTLAKQGKAICLDCAVKSYFP